MADDTTKRDYRDRDRINVYEDYELRYRIKELGVTPEKLKQLAHPFTPAIPAAASGLVRCCRIEYVRH